MIDHNSHKAQDFFSNLSPSASLVLSFFYHDNQRKHLILWDMLRPHRVGAKLQLMPHKLKNLLREEVENIPLLSDVQMNQSSIWFKET